ncbi:SDR family NAD(P)-dependent oxidoreductase [Nucisporomicrobium flavum]|uniref:SDR family NAD(P)-dependent oxidoreductase n=1 Tax=Nucisporomicrobium flavum TaxID=2785915 RepID=UPI0018F5D900|nr:SDR family oxidoreductase [Nucisporomicrobium flavum]
MNTLQNRTAVVTGAAKGIGAGIAAHLATAGANVVVNYRSDEAAAARVVASITALGGQAIAVRADVSQAADVAELFRAARHAFGPVDILVNNAGVYSFAPLTAVSAGDFEQQVGTNVLGTLLTMQAFAGQDDLGPASIVNVSTAGTMSHPPYAGLYVATKSAVNALTVVAAKELAARGIRVNAIAAGVSDTDGTRAMGFIGSAQAQQAVAEIPLGRLGAPDDYGPVVTFLSSDAARWITGDIVLVSGGQR